MLQLDVDKQASVSLLSKTSPMRIACLKETKKQVLLGPTALSGSLNTSMSKTLASQQVS